MLFSVNRLVSAWLSNISVQKGVGGGGGWGWRRGAFYSVLNSFNLNLLEWNRRSMGESDCFVISIYYWIGLQQDSVSAARVCLCADLFKSIMFPARLYSICTSINLQCSSPTLSPLCPALHFCSLSCSVLLCVLIIFPCFHPTFISTLLLSSIDTSTHTHLSLLLSLSPSPVYQTHNRPAAPKPAESPAACAQTDGREWWWATTAADSGSDQQHDCSKCQ